MFQPLPPSPSETSHIERPTEILDGTRELSGHKRRYGAEKEAASKVVSDGTSDDIPEFIEIEDSEEGSIQGRLCGGDGDRWGTGISNKGKGRAVTKTEFFYEWSASEYLADNQLHKNPGKGKKRTNDGDETKKNSWSSDGDASNQSSHLRRSDSQLVYDECQRNLFDFLRGSYPCKTETEIKRAMIEAEYRENDAVDILSIDSRIPEPNGNEKLSNDRVNILRTLCEWFPQVSEGKITTILIGAAWDQNRAANEVSQVAEATQIGAEDGWNEVKDGAEVVGQSGWKGKGKEVKPHGGIEDLDDDIVVFCDDIPAMDVERLSSQGSPAKKQRLAAEALESEKWVRENATDKRGFVVTLPKGSYHSRVNAELLNHIPAFWMCFNREHEKFEPRYRLQITRPVDSRTFSMILQWVGGYYLHLDEKLYQHGVDKLNALMGFVHAAILLGVNLEAGKASITDCLMDVLKADKMALRPAHVDAAFNRYNHNTAAQPIRELFAKSIATEYYSWREDPRDQRAMNEQLLYDAVAGAARRGLNGRGFRWELEKDSILELRELFNEYFFLAFRRRELVTKSKTRPAGIYILEPLTGKRELWYDAA